MEQKSMTLLDIVPYEDAPLCIVRIKTSIWSDKKGIHLKKDIIYLKRQCKGYNLLEEDVLQGGSEYIVPRIINLNKYKDGIYEVLTCNEKYDWESGYIDRYDYKLIPYDK